VLQKIHIQNFQSHLNTTIDLSPGLNIITGTSDHGKSSIIRAVRWFLLNRLKKGPKLYRSYSAKAPEAMSVRLVFSDGVDIERHSSPAMNAYIMNNDYDNPLKAIRSDIPAEVISAVRMNSVNIEGQHDKYFLLEDTPGHVAIKFNDVVGLEEMDDCMSESTSDIASSKKDLKVCKSKLDGLLEQLETLDWITEAIPELENLQILETRRTALNTKIPEVEKLIMEIVIIENSLKQIEDFTSLDSKLSNLENLNICISKIELLLASINSVRINLDACNAFLTIEDFYSELKKQNIRKKILDQNISTISTLISNIKNLEIRLLDLGDIVTQDVELSKLENLHYNINEKTQKIKEVETLLHTIYRTNKEIRVIEQEAIDLENSLHASLGAYESCPLCGFQISNVGE